MKSSQKKLITEIMEEDQKDGLYEQPEVLYRPVKVDHKTGKGYPSKNGKYFVILSNGSKSINVFGTKTGFWPNSPHESDVAEWLEPLPSQPRESVDALGEEILLDFIGIAPRGNAYLIKDGVCIKSQLLKAMEAYLYARLPIKIKSLCDTLQNTAQLLAGIKPDAITEGWWSEWDESVERSVIAELKAIQPFYSKEYAALASHPSPSVDAEPSPREAVEEMIKKYEAYISNLEWNINKNDLIGERSTMATVQLGCFREILSDLKSQIK